MNKRADETIVITDVNVIPCTGAETIGDATLVIERGRIAGIERGRRAGGTARRRISGRGRFVIPGLVDAHLHFIGAATNDFLRERLTTPGGLALLRSSRHAEALLEAGFTMVRDCGSTHALHLKRAIDEGVQAGPRILAAGFVLSQTFGHADDHFLPTQWVDYRSTGRGFSLLCDGADECRKAARFALREGADFIKICTSGGIMSERDRSDHIQFTIDEVRAVTEAAAAAGTFVASHAQNDTAIRNAILGGCRTIEHGFGVGDDTIKLAKQRGSIFVPTLLLDRAIIDGGVAAGFDAWAVRKMVDAWEVEVDHTRKLYRAGVTMALGSDALGSPLSRMGSNAREFTLLREYCGLDAHEILIAATRNGALACNRGDELGTIEPGKRADLLIVERDPIADIAVLKDPRRLHLVIKEGVALVRDGNLIR